MGIDDIHTFTIEKRCIDGKNQLWCLTQGVEDNYHSFWWSGFGSDADGRMLMTQIEDQRLVLIKSRDTWGKGQTLTELNRNQLVEQMTKLMTHKYVTTEACEAWEALPFRPGQDLTDFAKRGKWSVAQKRFSRFDGNVYVRFDGCLGFRIRELSVNDKVLQKIRGRECFATHAILKRAYIE